jgi:nitrite reductase/ring-hydroxylating ferredoxin subunit
VTEWVPVADLSELTRRNRKQVFVGDEPVALFLVNGDVYALHDTCMHKGRSLSRGAVLNGRVICPGHQWAFDPKTGYVEEQGRCQPSYPVRIEDGRVYVNPQQRVLIHNYDGIGSV